MELFKLCWDLTASIHSLADSSVGNEDFFVVMHPELVNIMLEIQYVHIKSTERNVTKWEDNRYHGRTVRGTPNCPLKLGTWMSQELSKMVSKSVITNL